jgi:hypothetical protein
MCEEDTARSCQVKAVVWKTTRIVGRWKVFARAGGRFIVLRRNPLNVFESQFRVDLAVTTATLFVLQPSRKVTRPRSRDCRNTSPPALTTSPFPNNCQRYCRSWDCRNRNSGQLASLSWRRPLQRGIGTVVSWTTSGVETASKART